MKKIVFLLLITFQLMALLNAQEVTITDDDIVYVDFEPDTVMIGSSIMGLWLVPIDTMEFLHLDIDGNGHQDIEIFRYSSPPMCTTNPYYPKLMIWNQTLFQPTGVDICTFNNSVKHGDTLPLQEYSDFLSYRFNFPEANSCDPIIYPPDPYPTPEIGNGIWPRHYVGIRKHIDATDSYCYGWLDIDVRYETPSIIKVTLYRMAYCKVPGYMFRAGQDEAVWDTVEERMNTALSLHPNPTTGLVSIVLPNNVTICQIEIRNMLGTLALEKNNMQGNTIDVSSLPAGVYIVRVVTNEGKEVFAKLVKK